MAKDLLLIALKRNLATAVELGQVDRVNLLEARVAAHEKAAAPKPEPALKSVTTTTPNKGKK